MNMRSAGLKSKDADLQVRTTTEAGERAEHCAVTAAQNLHAARLHLAAVMFRALKEKRNEYRSR